MLTQLIRVFALRPPSDVIALNTVDLLAFPPCGEYFTMWFSASLFLRSMTDGRC